jgi:nucleoside 2-deoxyribosyltransferase
MKSVTICSSNRFQKEADAFANKLRKAGVEVFSPHFYTASYGSLEGIKSHDKKFLAMGLTLDHFKKIRKADVVFIFNKGGYSGPSVSMELGYATALDTPVYALSKEDPEVCRDVLYDGYAETPEQLLKLLK